MDYDIIVDKLKEEDYKITRQRKAVLDVMLESKGHHLSAEDVLYKAKKKMPNIGIATVYRTLDRLASIDVLCKNMFDEDKYRYELSENEKHQHHHIICVKCGKITEIEDLLQNIESYVEKRGYKIIDHELKLYGYCPFCSEE